MRVALAALTAAAVLHPDRRSPEAFRVEDRVRNQHILPYLTIKHDFG